MTRIIHMPYIKSWTKGEAGTYHSIPLIFDLVDNLAELFQSFSWNEKMQINKAKLKFKKSMLKS